VVDHLWLGYGYAAFWEPNRFDVIAIARDSTIGYVPFYSHNGLIETLLNTGLVGMTLLAILLIRAVSTIFLGFRLGTAVPELMTALVIIVTFVLLNLTESMVLSRQSLIWMVFVAVVTKLGNVARAQSRIAAEPPVRRWSGTFGNEPRPQGER
jgi:exopolysaccharide production protein ExoQ